MEKMKVNRKTIALLALLYVSLIPLAASIWSSTIQQTAEPKLFIDPPSLYFHSFVPGKRFSLNIAVANVTDLKSYELKLSYNTLMLDVVGIAFFPEANLPVGDFEVNDAAGMIWFSTVYEGVSITTTSPVALVTITFKMMAVGTSLLHLYDSNLKDSLGVAITHSTGDGVVYIFRHDVAVISVVPSTSETYTGNMMNVSVMVKNKGDIAESFTVKAYRNDTVFATYDVVGLSAGANITIAFSWNTSDVAAGYKYVIKAEAVPVPYENNLADNVLVDGVVKVKIIGDVNNDDTVDFDDLAAWDAAYGSILGDVNWNVQADINGDGIVDKDDGMLIIQNYHNAP